MKSKQRLWIRVAVSVTLLLVAGVLVLAMNHPDLPVAEAQVLISAPLSDNPSAVPTELQAESGLPRTITVIGEGRVTMKPNVAQVNIGVEVVGDTVKDTSSQATDTMHAVMAALKARGVADKDMQTSGYNVWVERSYNPEGPEAAERVLYHVGNTVMVTIRNLDKVGTILDAAIEAGANNIYGVTFSVADAKPLMSDARAQAVVDARAKAQELAELNGVSLGQVLSISEVISSGGIYVGGIRAAAMAEGMGGGGAGPISPGELEMTTQLQITYAIQ